MIDEEHEDSSCGVGRKRAAMPGGANRQTFRPTMAAQTKSHKELPNGCEREDECADRRGPALWRSVFTFFMERFGAYAASMHLTAAFFVEAALIAARHPTRGRQVVRRSPPSMSTVPI